MLYEICRHIKNFFPDTQKQKSGHFKIIDNVIEPSISLFSGQYFLIEGSSMNDGVHLATDELIDEEFDGIITPMKCPKDFLSLVTEIESFQANSKPTDFTSESFGGYSYSKATNSSGQIQGWQSAFGTRLNAWRKL